MHVRVLEHTCKSDMHQQVARPQDVVKQLEQRRVGPGIRGTGSSSFAVTQIRRTGSSSISVGQLQKMGLDHYKILKEFQQMRSGHYSGIKGISKIFIIKNPPKVSSTYLGWVFSPLYLGNPLYTAIVT